MTAAGAVAGTCVFCGRQGPLSREHVWPRWMSTVPELQTEGCVGVRRGPLNASGDTLGPMLGWQLTVREVCAECNNGWMAAMEKAVRPVLTDLVAGRHIQLSEPEQPVLALWALKTALVSQLVLAAADRKRGAGVPPSEYAALQRSAPRPPARTQVWLGRYRGQRRWVSAHVTPLVAAPVLGRRPTMPNGYCFTIILGTVLIQGVRFPDPSLDLRVANRRDFPGIWPVEGPVVYPPAQVLKDDRVEESLKGEELRAADAGFTITHWRSATELPRSVDDGPWMVMLSPCQLHTLRYPKVLAIEAIKRRRYHAFVLTCPCDKAYLVRTQADGAHARSEGPLKAINERYRQLDGREVDISSPKFRCKRVSVPE